MIMAQQQKNAEQIEENVRQSRSPSVDSVSRLHQQSGGFASHSHQPNQQNSQQLHSERRGSFSKDGSMGFYQQNPNNGGFRRQSFNQRNSRSNQRSYQQNGEFSNNNFQQGFQSKQQRSYQNSSPYKQPPPQPPSTPSSSDKRGDRDEWPSRFQQTSSGPQNQIRRGQIENLPPPIELQRKNPVPSLPIDISSNSQPTTPSSFERAAQFRAALKDPQSVDSVDAKHPCFADERMQNALHG
ncbi:hypothetical protein CAEBREN_06599 [Caenorhabditis brenneri]|uniref:Uncharacterized protein n=1 Tax=Caenorhabditis brenneri TaxID=135651 RepID=G0PC39_CAEBE|nr:hypothetical protein CAEBREN_06599 [Caenorhabditis brenneri]